MSTAVKEGASRYPEWDGDGTIKKEGKRKDWASLLETPTVQFDFKQKHICLLKIKGTGEKQESK